MDRRRSIRFEVYRNTEQFPYEEKRKQTKKKSLKTFRNFCREQLEESSVTGVASIIKSKGWCRKLAKVLILLFGVAGFLLQTYEFLLLFWQYETVASVGNLDRMKKPAVTICDENLISRRFLCTNKPDLCTESIQFIFCGLYQAYCEDPNDLYLLSPAIIESYEDEYFDLNFTKEAGFDLERNILHCEWFSNEKNMSDEAYSTSCGEPEFIRAMNIERLPGACYTLKSNFKGDFDDVENLERGTILKLNLRWRASEQINVGAGADIVRLTFRHYYLSFHHPGELSNPFIEGFRITERKHYKVQVTEMDYVRMPPPFTTRCYDYVKDWNKMEGSGPLKREDCQAKCELDAHFETFGCVPRFVDYPHDKKLCITVQAYDQNLNLRIQNCITECRDACLETRYLTKSEVAAEITYESAMQKFNTPTVVTLEINFDVLKSKITEDKPKFESIELFSYIGGYLGMWLGWSLVAILDFFEIIFVIIKYPFLMIGKQPKKTAVQPFNIDSYFY